MKKQKRARNAFLVILFCLASVGLTANSAWAAADNAEDVLDDSFYEDSEDKQDGVADPLEDFNRIMFAFNDYTYVWIMEPVASSYSEIVPQDIREAVDNFCYNLQEPIRFVNALLQLRIADAGNVLARFAVNTIGGVGGLADVAGREFDFKPVEAGLGETFEFWGMGDGFYLVVPFLGASTVRELSGTAIDGLAMTPYYFLADSWREGFGIYMGRRLNNLSLRLGEYEDMKKLSVDPYTALRDGYFQRRRQARKHSAPMGDDKI